MEGPSNPAGLVTGDSWSSRLAGMPRVRVVPLAWALGALWEERPMPAGEGPVRRSPAAGRAGSSALGTGPRGRRALVGPGRGAGRLGPLPADPRPHALRGACVRACDATAMAQMAEAMGSGRAELAYDEKGTLASRATDPRSDRDTSPDARQPSMPSSSTASTDTGAAGLRARRRRRNGPAAPDLHATSPERSAQPRDGGVADVVAARDLGDGLTGGTALEGIAPLVRRQLGPPPHPRARAPPWSAPGSTRARTLSARPAR